MRTRDISPEVVDVLLEYEGPYQESQRGRRKEFYFPIEMDQRIITEFQTWINGWIKLANDIQLPTAKEGSKLLDEAGAVATKSKSGIEVVPTKAAKKLASAQIGTPAWIKTQNKKYLHQLLRWNDQSPGPIRESSKEKMQDAVIRMFETESYKFLVITEEQSKHATLIRSGVMDKDTFELKKQEDGTPEGYRKFKEYKSSHLADLPLTPEVQELIPDGFPDPRAKMTQETLDSFSDEELALWSSLRNRIKKSQYAKDYARYKTELKEVKDPATRTLMELDAQAAEKALMAPDKYQSPAALRKIMTSGISNMTDPAKRELMIQRQEIGRQNRKSRAGMSMTDLMQERMQMESENVLRPYTESLRLRPLETWSPMTTLEFYMNQTEIAEKMIDRVEGKAVQRTRMVDKEGEDVMGNLQSITPDAAVKVVMGFLQNIQLDSSGNPVLTGVEQPRVIEAQVIEQTVDIDEQFSYNYEDDEDW